MYHAESEKKLWSSPLHWAAAILPAVALGVFAMIAEGVSPVMWGQQAAAFVIFALLGLLRRGAQRIPSVVWMAACLFALTATLLFAPVGEARRWLDLGIFNVNAGMLVLPALLAVLSGMKCAHPALLFAAAVLCVQPDFSQLAAFSLGVLPILWLRRKRVFWSAASLIFLAVCLVWCADIPTALEPAAYCEGILAMLGNLSPLMQVMGWLALALVPGWFAFWFCRHGDAYALCLALYYAATVLFSVSGEYPVPFMGFGLSPIAGYWLAYLLLPPMQV